MAKTFSASITIELGQVTPEAIKENRSMARFFKDPDNPTAAEAKNYFRRQLEDYAGSNDGSEMLANARIDVKEEEAG